MITLIISIVFMALIFKRKQGFFSLTENGKMIKNKWGHLISNASLKWNIPENVIIGTIGIESNGNENVVGGKKEIGLMQILPGTFSDYEKETGTKNLNAFNPTINIDAGTWFLDKINRTFPLEDWEDKIQAYNVGINGYQKGRRNLDYVNRLFQYVKL